MEMKAKAKRVTNMIPLMPTDTIEALTSPVNVQGDNDVQYFSTECHGTNWRHPTEVLNAKVKKPQF